MGMTRNRKKYYFKFQKDFFEDHKIRCLAGDASGIIFDEMTQWDKNEIEGLAAQCVYIRLLAESCSHDGRLRFDERTPYTTKMLSLAIGISERVVSMVVEQMKTLGLIETLEDGTLYLPAMPPMQGCETEAAGKMRSLRSERAKSAAEPAPSAPDPTDTPDSQPPASSWSPTKEDLERFYSSAFLPPADKERFVAHCLQTLCMAHAKRWDNPSFIIKSKYNEWKASLKDTPLTWDELVEKVKELNDTRRGSKITRKQMTDFWNAIAADDFKTTSKGEVISKRTVGRTLTKWLQSREEIAARYGNPPPSSRPSVGSAAALPEELVAALPPSVAPDSLSDEAVQALLAHYGAVQQNDKAIKNLESNSRKSGSWEKPNHLGVSPKQKAEEYWANRAEDLRRRVQTVLSNQ